ncbi:MAG: UvrD-helicase domain-containing protein [Flavobacteriales bacterium]
MANQKNFQVYKASAGSGKTSRMVQEYLILALGNENPAYFKKILGITFTNKAANELKERIVHTLQSICELPVAEFQNKYFIKPLLDELNISATELKKRAEATLKIMLHQYSELSVGTIDSFMHRLVRAFSRDLNLPMNFQVELDADLLLNEAIESLIAQVGIDEKITTNLRDFIIERLDDERSFRVEDEIKNMAKQLFSDESIEYVRKLEHITAAEFDNARKQLKGQTRIFENEVKRLRDAMMEILNKHGLEVEDFAYGNSGIGGFINKCYDKLTSEGMLIPGKRVLEAPQTPFWTSAKQEQQIVEKAVKARDEILPYLLELLDLLDEPQGKYIIQSMILNQLHALSLLNDLRQILSDIRKESGRVHISEFNKRVLHIVATETVPFIYERLGERYNHILIDEFQDTSVAQWHNLMPLIENAISKGFKSMIVGDGKQAIYRWRGGFAEQFTALPEMQPHSNDEIVIERFAQLQFAYEQQQLVTNRRSCKEIVEFNNRFFKKLSQETQYTEALRSIYEDIAQEAVQEKQGGLVRIEYLPYKSGHREEFRALIFEKTISLIRDLIIEQNYEYKDIALLTRGNRDASELAAWLLENEIPVISSEALLINNSPDVQFLLAWLDSVRHPEKHSPIIVILNYLEQKKIIDQAKGKTEFFKSIFNLELLLSFLRSHQIKLDKIELSSLTMFELCHLLCRSFNISTSDNAFVRFFLEHIWQRTIKDGNDVATFMSWWEEKKSSLSIITPSDANAVKIMTIHKSKGLQFPVVIIPFGIETQSKASLIWLDAAMETDGILPVALTKLNAGLNYTRFAELYQKELNRRLQDAANLLYVAFTRPEDALFVFTSNGRKDNVWEPMLHLIPEEKPEKEKEVIYHIGAKQVKGRSVNAKAIIQKDGLFSQLPHVFANSWRNRLSLSTDTSKLYFIHEGSSAQSNGNLIHAILEEIKHENDLVKVLHSFEEKGLISVAQKPVMQDYITQIFAHPDLKNAFHRETEVKNEQTIVFPDGTIRRPDRIVKIGQIWKVIDFKTGLKRPEHEKQVREYQKALIQMTGATVQAYLVYVGANLEVVSLN